MFDEPCDAPVLQGFGQEDPEAACDDKIVENRAREHGVESGVLYTTGNIEDIFHCISMVCTRNAVNTPLKSNPMFRASPPLIRLVNGFYSGGTRNKNQFSFHLPPDYRILYSAAPLAYYLGAPVEVDDEPYISFKSARPMPLPEAQMEEWMAEMLRRTFYLDCAVRYAWVSGEMLNGLDVWELLGMRAGDVFNMESGERFLLYAGLSASIPGLPVWHMASYVDPVAESVEALPFLLRSLSAIYSPRSTPTTERGLVSMAVQNFLGRRMAPDMAGDGAIRSVVVPSLREAGSQLWFSAGFPIDAAKASVRAFENRQRYGRDKKRQVRVGIICNEPTMEEEVDVIVKALSDTPIRMQMYWGVGVSGFTDVFARGFDVVQLIGHCDVRGFKCSDGFARVGDIRENNTPMFFFNSCASHGEAARLVEMGSVCGVATFFRVLEEAAVDVCRGFYLMLGEGYPASVSINAAMECSVLGKEYLLIGDGSYTCYDGGDLKRFYRVTRHGDGYTLGCTVCNTDKGYVIGSWFPDGKRAITDLGFETRSMSWEHLMAIAKKFKGYCLYNRNIYTSVEEAALKALQDERRPPNRHRVKTRRSYG
jgi:hypothetical protein